MLKPKVNLHDFSKIFGDELHIFPIFMGEKGEVHVFSPCVETFPEKKPSQALHVPLFAVSVEPADESLRRLRSAAAMEVP